MIAVPHSLAPPEPAHFENVILSEVVVHEVDDNTAEGPLSLG